MSKRLQEMSLEELWMLFPIQLTPHDLHWKEWYLAEVRALRQDVLAERQILLSHVGSTAVPGIWAKPIIDILAEVPDVSSFSWLESALQSAGYLRMARSAMRMSFNKGYTENGFAQRVFHLHARVAGDNDELYFRDYLLAHPDVAKAYEELKLSLWPQYEHDRDGYTESKSEFVREITQRAKDELHGRYERSCEKCCQE